MDKGLPGAGPTLFNLSPEVEALLFEALTLPPEARSDFLEGATDEPSLKAQVQLLLEAHGQADADLGALGARIEALAQGTSAQLPFEHAGPWRLVSLLGRGGMSAVYRVERDDGEFEQTAALKLLPAGPMVDAMVQRFRSERSILARLDHPNLARLLDGGMTEEGLPYLVMEFVDGVPIDQYCDQHKLSVDGRLALFEQVLKVVQYAHQNLIVHRDLKPSNILVTTQGQVKLLDFGIAKVLDEELGSGEATELTRLSGRPMTLAWSSPEQVAGSAITTATDVYTLGLLLYKLLTGQLPFSGLAPGELRRAIEADTPAPPSASAANDASQARIRSSKPERLRRRLLGDLDNIILTCLNKEPERRYSTVSELADDLDRHRRNLPVRARPDRWGYRAGRFIARHRLGASLALIIPLVATIAAGWHIDRLANERDRAELEAERAETAALVAEQEAEKARQVANFMVGLFRQADPVIQSDQELTALELLERGRARIDEMDASPELRAHMNRTFARVHETRADYPLAIALYQQALALLPPEDLSGREELLTELAMAYFHYGDLEMAEQHIRAALDINPETQAFQQGVNLNMLGNILRDSSRREEAEAAYLQAIALHEALDPETLEASTAWINLGVLKLGQRLFEPAREAFENALAVRLKILGPDHPWTSIPQANLAFILLQLGEHEQALEHYELALAQRRASLGDRHPRLAAIHHQLGHVNLAINDPESAARHFQAAHDINSAALTPGHRNISLAGIGLAEALLRQGDDELAGQWVRSALSDLDSSNERAGLDHASAYDVLGHIAVVQDDIAAARQWHEAALAIRQELLEPGDDRRWRAKLVLASTSLKAGDQLEASRLLASAHQALSTTPGQFRPLWERLDALQRQHELAQNTTSSASEALETPHP